MRADAPGMNRILPWADGWRLAVLLMAGAGIASVLLGPDRSWDTRNYHLYVPWALLAGRPADVLPAPGRAGLPGGQHGTPRSARSGCGGR